MKTITASGSRSISARLWRGLTPVSLTLLAALAVAIIVPARAETPPSAIPFSDIGARATAGYQGDALSVTTTADGALLRCGCQKLAGYATPQGLWLESTGPGKAGKFRVVAATLRRVGNSTAIFPLPATGTVSVQDKLVRFTRPGLTEEYSVSVDGVRQDFVIAAPPAGAGDLCVELALSGARAEAAAGGARLTLAGSGRKLAYSRLRAEDAAGRELTARLELLSADRLAVSVADANATYPVRIDPTFSDADWVSLNPGIPGANGRVIAIAVDGSGNVYVAGNFTVIGTVQANYIAKWDGSTWSALGSGMDDVAGALAVSGTNLYVGGGFTKAGGVTVSNIAKWDGSAWSALGSGMNDGVNALAVSGTDLYAGGYFTDAGGVAANYIAKWDGSAWSALGSGISGRVYSQPTVWTGPSVSALAVIGTNLYAGGEFTNAGGVPANCIAKWDGSAWSALGSGVGGYAPCVLALAGRGTDLYAGGAFTTTGGVPANCIAKWDGSAWSALGSGMYGYGVLALAVSGTDLYAGGDFTTAGGVPANYIAKWDGSAWSALGSGLGPSYLGPPWVYALAVSGTDLYAGGQFTTAGGVPAYIAKWDGSVWSALGSGIPGYVDALAVSGTILFAGGNFRGAGCIAKWDGSAWSALGSGLSGSGLPEVSALAVSGTDVYAGGYFTTAGGVPANNIAKWNGSAWSALGSGITGSVSALSASGTDVYAGGYFTTAGGVPANNIAKWNGSAWSALGSGINGQVYALAVSGTDLYAGGSFTTAGGVPANYIAKWDGSAWSALGSGTGPVSALAVSGTNLYAGGQFTTAGAVPANRIARWDGNAWAALGSGMNNSVLALAADGAGHLFVGGNFYLAGTNVSPYIAQANIGSVPTIMMPPQTQTAEAGATVHFAVDAVGEPPPAYQWYFNGTNILSCTNSNLQLANILFPQSGTYCGGHKCLRCGDQHAGRPERDYPSGSKVGARRQPDGAAGKLPGP